MADRVRFLGFRPVSKLLPEWDVFAYSTTESEGMGTAVAEAMMAGLPCLVSDLPVMREICGSKGAAFAPVGDADGFARALLELIHNQQHREALGFAAKSRAHQLFGLSETADAYARALFPNLNADTPNRSH